MQTVIYIIEWGCLAFGISLILTLIEGEIQVIKRRKDRLKELKK